MNNIAARNSELYLFVSVAPNNPDLTPVDYCLSNAMRASLRL